MRRHVPCSTVLYLPAKVGSSAAMCSVALDPASLLGRVPVLPYVLWLRTRLSDREGFGATACPMAPDSTSLSRGVRRCHVSYSFMWTVCLKHKEKPSWPANVVRLTCFQSMHTCFQGV
jgi:hypothetical protein